MTRRSAAGIGVGLVVLAGACGPAPDEILDGVAAARPNPPIEKPDFSFTDTEGRPFDFRAETEGSLTLLFFGYTHCPDVCPLNMARIARALEAVPEEVRAGVEVVFVSVDPTRDSPDRVRRWLDGFDSTFVGLTAPQERVDALMGTLDFPPTLFPDGTDGEGYGVGHPGMVWGFTPDGAGRLLWFAGATADDFKGDMEQVLAHRW